MTNCYADLMTIKRRLGISAETKWDTDFITWMNTSSRFIDEHTRRWFYVLAGTRYQNGSDSDHLFTDDILSITTLKIDADCDGTFEDTYTVDTDYNLVPYDGYPKTEIEISSRAGRSYSDFGGNLRKIVQIVGSFGYGNGLSATPYVDSGAVVNTGNMTDSASTHALATGKGASFAAGQTILIGSEQLHIASISTDTLTFTLNPTRNQNGTTAAAHTAGDKIYIYQYPATIVEACITQVSQWYKLATQTGYTGLGGSADYGGQTVIKGLDPNVKLMLAPFVKRGFV